MPIDAANVHCRQILPFTPDATTNVGRLGQFVNRGACSIEALAEALVEGAAAGVVGVVGGVCVGVVKGIGEGVSNANGLADGVSKVVLFGLADGVAGAAAGGKVAGRVVQQSFNAATLRNLGVGEEFRQQLDLVAQHIAQHQAQQDPGMAVPEPRRTAPGTSQRRRQLLREPEAGAQNLGLMLARAMAELDAILESALPGAIAGVIFVVGGTVYGLARGIGQGLRHSGDAGARLGHAANGAFGYGAGGATAGAVTTSRLVQQLRTDVLARDLGFLGEFPAQFGAIAQAIAKYIEAINTQAAEREQLVADRIDRVP